MLNELFLKAGVSPNDLNILNQVLNNNKNISSKDRNNLINKLSSSQQINEIPQKEFRDMNEQEKKIHKEELRKKLKNKQNEKKMLRTNHLGTNNNAKYNEAISKVSELISKSTNIINQNQNENVSKNDQQESNDSKLKSQVDLLSDMDLLSKIDFSSNQGDLNESKKFDINKLNEFVNKKEESEDTTNLKDINDENIDDYIK